MTVKPAILIKREHVRRAFRAATTVYDEARSADVVATGVVLMTAIFLVERLAESLNTEPLRLLQTMARSLERKRKYAERFKDPN